MDFANRNPQVPAGQPTPASPSSQNMGPARNHKANSSRALLPNKWWQGSALALLFSVTVLAIAVIGVLAFGNSSQAKYINSKKYQAVFLNSGQVYFGNIKQMGSDYLRLQNVYYLQTSNTGNSSNSSSSSSSSNNNNYTLVQLGCQQIHDPYNEMIINRDQISFWENLQDSGQVVQKINQFKKQYPNGPDCSQVSSQTQASGSNAQGSSAPSSSSSNSSSNSSSSSSNNSSTNKNP